MALGKKNIPILVGGGISTKVNPKLVRSPALLELENMYQAKTGELRPRGGMVNDILASLFVNSNAVAAMTTINDETVLIERSSFNGNASMFTLDVPTAAGPVNVYNQRNLAPHPAFVTSLDAVYSGGVASTLVAGTDLVDPDICSFGQNIGICWTEFGGAGVVQFMTATLSEMVIGNSVPYSGFVATRRTAGRGRMCGGSASGAMFFLDNGVTPSIVAIDLVTSVETTIAVNAVLATQPWFDVRLKTGTNRAIVTFRDAANQLSILEYDMGTHTVTLGPVSAAVTDATVMCVGILNDSIGATSHVVYHAGTTTGMKCSFFSATTLAHSSTVLMDGTATASVRNVMGHQENASGTVHRAYWEIDNATKQNRLIRHNAYNAAPGVFDFQRSVGISGKSTPFQINGVAWYMLPASYESSTQTVQLLLQDSAAGNAGGIAGTFNQALSGQFANGSCGGGTVAASCPTAMIVSPSSNELLMPVSIRTRVTGADGGVFKYTRSIKLARINISPHLRPSQLDAGSLVFPGGALTCYDGHASSSAVQVVTPEAPTLTPGAAGSLTPSKTYSFKACWAWRTASGALWRGAPGLPTSVLLGGAQNSVTVTAGTLRLCGPTRNGETFPSAPYIEIYRAGPIEDGAVNYNLDGTIENSSSVDTVNYVSTANNATVQAKELLYTTGGVLDNFCPPAAELSVTSGQRVWLPSAENPDEVWYSKQIKGGQTGFNPALVVRLAASRSGKATAIAAMDGRTIIFKRGAIFVVSGDGPTDAGQGGYADPQAVSLSIGAINSALAVSDKGIFFQAESGIWLLDRGLSLSFVGAPVEQYTKAETMVDACLVDALAQIRFVSASGRVLVWDLYHESWVTYVVPVQAGSVFGCANKTSGWTYAASVGSVFFLYREDLTALADYSNLTVIPKISFPHLDFAGIGGYQRFYGLAFTLDTVGAHTVSVDAEFDYLGAVTGSPRTKALPAATPGVVVEYLPPEGKAKGTSVRPVITISGAALSGSFRLTGAMATVGVKKGNRAVETNRLT